MKALYKKFHHLDQLIKSTEMETVNNFLCNECGKGYEEEYQMLVHQYHTHDKTPFKCVDCGVCGIGRQWFSNHRRQHREKRKKTLKTYKCHLCPYEQHDLPNFRRHAKCHTAKPDGPKKQKKSRTCGSCGKIFARKDSFDRHTKVHLKDTAQG